MGFLDSIGSAISSGIKTVGDAASGVVHTVEDEAKTAFKVGKDVADVPLHVAEAAGSAIKDDAGAIAHYALNTPLDFLKDAAETGWDGLKAPFEAVGALVTGHPGEALGALEKPFGDMIHGGKDLVSNQLDLAKGLGKCFLEVPTAVIKDGVQTGKDGIGGEFQIGKDVIGTDVKVGTDVVQGNLETAKKLFN
jgi:hypothetical protein